MRHVPLVLLLAGCNLPQPSPPPDCSDGCGGPEDCTALCATVERLGCRQAWGIDEGDGSCLELCQLAETEGPPVCPRRAAQGTTCEEVDQLSQCGGEL